MSWSFWLTPWRLPILSRALGYGLAMALGASGSHIVSIQAVRRKLMLP